VWVPYWPVGAGCAGLVWQAPLQWEQQRALALHMLKPVWRTLAPLHIHNFAHTHTRAHTHAHTHTHTRTHSSVRAPSTVRRPQHAPGAEGAWHVVQLRVVGVAQAQESEARAREHALLALVRLLQLRPQQGAVLGGVAVPCGL